MNEENNKIFAPMRFIASELLTFFKKLKKCFVQISDFFLLENEGANLLSMDFENRIHIRQDINSDVREHEPQYCSAP